VRHISIHVNNRSDMIQQIFSTACVASSVRLLLRTSVPCPPFLIIHGPLDSNSFLTTVMDRELNEGPNYSALNAFPSNYFFLLHSSTKSKPNSCGVFIQWLWTKFYSKVNLNCLICGRFRFT
jgi:hypothetical protein